MRDFNFFSPYIDLKRTKKTHKRYAIIAGVLVTCILSGALTWSIYSIKTLEKDISDKEKFLNSPKIKESLEEYEELQALIDKLDKYYNSMKIVDDAINKRDLLRISLLDNIASAMPQETFLQSVSGGGNGIELVCTSANKNAVAELERNLKQIQGIDTVHVFSTKRIDNYFTSSIIIKIKEVAVSEAD